VNRKDGEEGGEMNKNSDTEDVIKEYNRLASVYDYKWSRYIQTTISKVVEYCALSGEEDILDVACGTGELERILLTRYGKIKITGCDISSAMLEIAEKKLTGFDNISFIECPADRIPLKDGSEDVIICCNSFHFLKHPEKVLQEWHRILRQGGKVFILDWCRDFLLCKVFEFFKQADKNHHRIYTVGELSSMLAAHGFRNQGDWRFKVGWFWGMMALSGQKILL
jgi:ubiquinone/menaquinone biosynthesis C-methylase UbiE